jgi:hypothetical protein
MEDKLKWTRVTVEELKQALTRSLASVIEVSSLLTTTQEVVYCVCIRPEYPGQIQVRSRLRRSLRGALKSCLYEFEKKNGNHPDVDKFPVRPCAFINIKGTAFMVGLDTDDAENILLSEGSGKKGVLGEKIRFYPNTGVWVNWVRQT